MLYQAPDPKSKKNREHNTEILSIPTCTKPSWYEINTGCNSGRKNTRITFLRHSGFLQVAKKKKISFKAWYAWTVRTVVSRLHLRARLKEVCWSTRQWSVESQIFHSFMVLLSRPMNDSQVRNGAIFLGTFGLLSSKLSLGFLVILCGLNSMLGKCSLVFIPRVGECFNLLMVHKVKPRYNVLEEPRVSWVSWRHSLHVRGERWFPVKWLITLHFVHHFPHIHLNFAFIFCKAIEPNYPT